MASKRQNIFDKNTKQETTEMDMLIDIDQYRDSFAQDKVVSHAAVNSNTMNFSTSLMLMVLAAGVAESYVIPQYLSIDGDYLIPYGELESHIDEKGDRPKEISISVLVWAPAVLDLLDWGMTIKSGKEGAENLYTLEEHTWAILAMENHATILASEGLSSFEMDPNFINSLSMME
ncbi:hypothetical protein AAG570_006373 [Ranatra chinensis]|uniref:Uncharacterized protein n=1 Tax=Ranatra chinensis TaxID=642074 RepID=A0ABD0YTS7_9HEMI